MKKSKNIKEKPIKRSKAKKIFILFLIFILVIAVLFFIIKINKNKPKDIIYIDGIAIVDNGYIENDIILDSLDRTSEEWLEYEDLEKVKKDIDGQINKIKSAFDSGKVSKIVKYFSENEKEYYISLFETREDLISDIGKYFDDVELVYLSEKIDSKETSFHRIAEYLIKYDNNEISVVFIYEDGDWYIKSL